MWEILETDRQGYLSNKKRLGDRHPAETAQIFDRLEQLLFCLNKSDMPLPAALQRGWVHHKYKAGVKSIDGGGGKGRAALRLYFFPDASAKIIVVLGFGEKADERKEISNAYATLHEYMSGKE